MSEATNKFCKRHAINIINTNKRAYKPQPFDVVYFNNPTDYNMIREYPVVIETVKVFTVEILETSLERLAKFEEEVFNRADSISHYNLFEVMMAQKHEEAVLRDTNIAVKKAYEHYSLMLSIAKAGAL
jgi:signal peptidase I